jgi:hypothetical protein
LESLTAKAEANTETDSGSGSGTGSGTDSGAGSGANDISNRPPPTPDGFYNPDDRSDSDDAEDDLALNRLARARKGLPGPLATRVRPKKTKAVMTTTMMPMAVRPSAVIPWKPVIPTAAALSTAMPTMLMTKDEDEGDDDDDDDDDDGCDDDDDDGDGDDDDDSHMNTTCGSCVEHQLDRTVKYSTGEASKDADDGDDEGDGGDDDGDDDDGDDDDEHDSDWFGEQGGRSQNCANY